LKAWPYASHFVAAPSLNMTDGRISG